MISHLDSLDGESVLIVSFRPTVLGLLRQIGHRSRNETNGRGREGKMFPAHLKFHRENQELEYTREHFTCLPLRPSIIVVPVTSNYRSNTEEFGEGLPFSIPP